MKKASGLSDELKRRLAQKLIEYERRRAREGGLNPSGKDDQRASRPNKDRQRAGKPKESDP
jgi:hypothetical protein